MEKESTKLGQLPLFRCESGLTGLVGDSPEIQHILQTLSKLRGNRLPVLLLGETGTGKELVARALHTASPGDTGAFVPLDSAALPATLIESQLFGHLRGAFTGAAQARRGLIEQAHGGTLFLDEIGELPLEMQAKLLRTIQQKEIRPLGSERIIPVDVRIIAATNRDLKVEVQQGRFRSDLFYRLNVITLSVPPLRERRTDIPRLAQYFLGLHQACQMNLSKELIECLKCHDWPGNVRELENCIMRMVALASRTELTVADLPPDFCAVDHPTPPSTVVLPPRVVPLRELQELGIRHAMQMTKDDPRQAARLLGIGKTTLYRKLKQCGRGRASRLRIPSDAA